MALFGSPEAVRAQLAMPERFTAAFDYVAECGRTGSPAQRLLAGLAAGQTERVDLAGGAFALLQAYLTKPVSEGKWETHRAYIDVQAVTEGEELFGVADLSRLTVAEDLTPERDVIFYRPFESGSMLRLAVGDVALLFPADGHMGSLQVGAPAFVRKVVVKVPVKA